jgi:hypothetical protein
MVFEYRLRVMVFEYRLRASCRGLIEIVLSCPAAGEDWETRAFLKRKLKADAVKSELDLNDTKKRQRMAEKRQRMAEAAPQLEKDRAVAEGGTCLCVCGFKRGTWLLVYCISGCLRDLCW